MQRWGKYSFFSNLSDIGFWALMDPCHDLPHTKIEDPAAPLKRDLRLRRTSPLRSNDSTELVEVNQRGIRSLFRFKTDGSSIRSCDVTISQIENFGQVLIHAECVTFS